MINLIPIRPKFYECGICGYYHSDDWDGDCRYDAERLDPIELDELYGINGWDEVSM